MNSVNRIVFRVLLNHVNIFIGTSTMHIHIYYILIKLMNLNLYTRMQISRIDNEINSNSSQLVFSQGIVDFITPFLVLPFARVVYLLIGKSCRQPLVGIKYTFSLVAT